ncbi:MAG: type II toxin-antitoxin system YafQ family toxin [Bacteroidota bacterium]
MYQLEFTTKFKKDLKKIKKQGSDFSLVALVLKLLNVHGVAGINLTMKPHKLKGEFKDHWECHIKPDLLIIWFQIESPKTIRLIRLGSHSDLFG